jgi:cell shape-determining protein MreC
MKNPAKAAVLLIFLLLIIIVFFAYTGVNVRKPEQAMYIMVDKVIEINRAINRMIDDLIISIQTKVSEVFSR